MGVGDSASQQSGEDLAGLLRHAGEGCPGIRRRPLLPPGTRRQVQLPRQPARYSGWAVSSSLGDPGGGSEVRERGAAEGILRVAATLPVGIISLRLHDVVFLLRTFGKRNHNGRSVLEHKGLQLYGWWRTRNVSAEPHG